MLGKDFFVFWQMGLAILRGEPFYSSPESLYPPATSLLFTPLGILPFPIAFSLWTGLNVLLYLLVLRKLNLKNAWGWYLFTPTLFILMTGQIDIIFLWFSSLLLHEEGWKQIGGAVLLTLKPQIAFIILPWYLVRWIKQKPRSLLIWVLACLGLHLAPLVFDPMIYHKWLHSISSYQSTRMTLSPGFFSLSNFDLPLWIPILLSLPFILIGLKKDLETSKAAQILALPMGIWYENVLLIGALPDKYMIPLSWLVFLVAYLCKSNVPFALLPLIVFVWKVATPRQTPPVFDAER